MDAIEELGRVAQALKLEQEEDFRLHELYLKQQDVHQRRRAGLCWFPLRIVERGYGLGDYPFLVVERPGEKSPHQFQSSSPVSLFSAQPGNENESLHGTIGYVDSERMKIIFRIDELPDWIDDGKIGVNLLFDSRTYDEMWKALNFFINVEKGRSKELRDILLGQRTASFTDEQTVHSVRLNQSQQEAMSSILRSEDVAIVHGPPGTGKTTTLVEAIRALTARGEQVLVTAPSNAAVDHLTRSLGEAGVRVVRVGNLAKVEENTTGYTLDILVAADKEYKRVKELKKRAAELRSIGGKYKRQFGREEAEQRKLLFKEAREVSREARELEEYMVRYQLDSAQAIACTLIGSTHEYLEGRRFSVVIIDEAGQALEPACWVPVAKADRVVMAGDPYQLPPTVKSQDAAKAGLSVTLLEKAIQRLTKVDLLRTQYRMNELIMQFSNDRFYQNQLEAHESVRHWFLEPSPDVVEFIDTAGCGFTEESGESGESLVNPGEVNTLVSHFNQLQALTGSAITVGIISPYRAQVELLQERIGSKPGVAINTIDSFQGQERDVIYLSLVRSNEKGEIGFLKDYRRMNVAMTRARKKLVVIGDSATLGNDRFYAAFLDFAEKSASYRTAWEWMEY